MSVPQTDLDGLSKRQLQILSQLRQLTRRCDALADAAGPEGRNSGVTQPVRATTISAVEERSHPIPVVPQASIQSSSLYTARAGCIDRILWATLNEASGTVQNGVLTPVDIAEQSCRLRAAMMLLHWSMHTLTSEDHIRGVAALDQRFTVLVMVRWVLLLDVCPVSVRPMCLINRFALHRM